MTTRHEPSSPGPKEPPCGDIYLDGQYLGRFWEPCEEVEKLLLKMTGRRIRLPRPKPDPDDRFLFGDDVLCLNILRRDPRKSLRAMAGTSTGKLGQLAAPTISRKSRRSR